MVMNVLEALLLHPLFHRTGVDFEATLLDECVLGLAMGVVICVIEGLYRRRYRRALRESVDELNHHVRNAMQVIMVQNVLCPHCDSEHVSKAIERVDWALREVLPAEMQPER